VERGETGGGEEEERGRASSLKGLRSISEEAELVRGSRLNLCVNLQTRCVCVCVCVCVWEGDEMRTG